MRRDGNHFAVIQTRIFACLLKTRTAADFTLFTIQRSFYNLKRPNTRANQESVRKAIYNMRVFYQREEKFDAESSC